MPHEHGPDTGAKTVVRDNPRPKLAQKWAKNGPKMSRRNRERSDKGRRHCSDAWTGEDDNKIREKWNMDRNHKVVQKVAKTENRVKTQKCDFRNFFV